MNHGTQMVCVYVHEESRLRPSTGTRDMVRDVVTLFHVLCSVDHSAPDC